MKIIKSKVLFTLFLAILSIHLIAASHIDSLKSSLSNDITENEFNTLIVIAEYYYEDNFDTALYYSQKAEKIANLLEVDELIARAYENKALCYFYNNKHAEAIEIFRKELAIWHKLDKYAKEARAYTDIGLLNSQSGELDSALFYYRIALGLYSEANDKLGQVHTINKIALVQRRLGNLNVALDKYFIALKMAVNNNLIEEEGSTCNDIGIVYRHLNKRNLALNYFNRAIKIYEELSDTNKLGVLFNNIGSIYVLDNNTDSAMIFFEKSLKIYTDLKNWIFVSKILSNISYIVYEQGDYDKALEYANRALEINLRQGYKLNLITNYYNFGLFYFAKKDFPKSKDYFLKSLDLALASHTKQYIQRVYGSLYDLDIEMGDYKNALKNYKLSIAYRDSVLTEKTKKDIAEIQAKYETENTKAENKILRLEKEKESMAKIRLYFVSAFLLLLVIYLVSLVISRLKRLKLNKQNYEKEHQLNIALKKTAETEKKRFQELIFAEKKINELQNEKIASKNKELLAIVRSIHHKNKILSKISKHIDEIQVDDNSISGELREIKNLISGKQMLEEDWNLFKNQIEQVYHNFFEKLQKKCPSFTAYDIKLSSYLLIDMSSKEIAALMNVTTAAIIKSRQRLRKKVNIDTNEEFLKFIRQI